MEEFNHFVFYDIEKDGVRLRVSETCKDYGLERIQFSGFMGRLTRNMREELFLKLTDAVKEGAGKILILPVCDKDYRNRLEFAVEPEDGDDSARG
ncbi:MAG TPA: CRISPR-associated endonuclease Cas2 [Deltaproteobacteria bacterium]|nr:CRISPR-associated endonuclease Cas2 [Deltaproteobacteria bacterium]